MLKKKKPKLILLFHLFVGVFVVSEISQAS